MRENLHSTLTQIQQGSNDLLLAADAMRNTAQINTDNLQRQNQQVEHTAAAINQMAASVAQVARHANATALSPEIASTYPRKASSACT